MISDEDLQDIASVDDWYMGVHLGDMARELLALRKYLLMPSELTAENGAKAALMGEFKEKYSISCPECFGDDDCETCDGSGRIHVEVPVSWTTIKEIWAKGLEHFHSAEPEAE